VSKFELPERQFERTVKDKIACKIHLEWENDSFKHIFGILIKFPMIFANSFSEPELYLSFK